MRPRHTKVRRPGRRAVATLAAGPRPPASTPGTCAGVASRPPWRRATGRPRPPAHATICGSPNLRPARPGRSGPPTAAGRAQPPWPDAEKRPPRRRGDASERVAMRSGSARPRPAPTVRAPGAFKDRHDALPQPRAAAPPRGQSRRPPPPATIACLITPSPSHPTNICSVNYSVVDSALHSTGERPRLAQPQGTTRVHHWGKSLGGTASRWLTPPAPCSPEHGAAGSPPRRRPGRPGSRPARPRPTTPAPGRHC